MWPQYTLADPNRGVRFEKFSLINELVRISEVTLFLWRQASQLTRFWIQIYYRILGIYIEIVFSFTESCDFLRISRFFLLSEPCGESATLDYFRLSLFVLMCRSSLEGEIRQRPGTTSICDFIRRQVLDQEWNHRVSRLDRGQYPYASLLLSWINIQMWFPSSLARTRTNSERISWDWFYPSVERDSSLSLPNRTQIPV